MPRPPLLQIIWQDPHLAAVAKPSGLASIPGRGQTTSALEETARLLGLPHRGSADPRLRLVHRIDLETSGLLLFAKDRPAQQHLSHQFQNNTVGKEYLALVRGSPDDQAGQIDAPIAADRNSHRMTINTHHGRPARTAWQVEQRFAEYSLLRVMPKTGKTHQIRVHLASIGLPLAIDALYNPLPAGAQPGIYLSTFKQDYHPSTRRPEQPLIERLTLHARSLEFLDLQNRPVKLEAPLPKDFRAVLNMLQKYSSR